MIITTPIRKNLLAQLFFRATFILFNPCGVWTHIKEYSVVELFEKIIPHFKVIYFFRSKPVRIIRGLLNAGGGRQIFVGEK